MQSGAIPSLLRMQRLAVTQVVECLPSKCEVPEFKPQYYEKKKYARMQNLHHNTAVASYAWGI
jgi:hypothetical protein